MKKIPRQIPRQNKNQKSKNKKASSEKITNNNKHQINKRILESIKRVKRPFGLKTSFKFIIFSYFFGETY